MKLTSIEDLSKPGVAAIEQQAFQIGHQFEAFLDDYPDDGHERLAGVHASELASCKRQVVYTLYGTEKRGKVPGQWRKRFLVGTAIHSMLQSDFHKMAMQSGGYMTFQAEVRVDDTPLARELFLTSSCDGVFTWFDKKGEPFIRMGLEAKSKAPDDFAKMKKPEEKHVKQAHLYMACLDLPLMWVLYWNKGNQNMSPSIPPYMVRFDPAIWNEQRVRAQEAVSSATAQTLPEREESIACSWCQYAWTCQPPGASRFQKPPQRRPLLPIIRR